MIKYNYSYTNYLIEKIRNSTNAKEESFPNKQEFRLALHEIYFSKNTKKIGELSNILACYYIKRSDFDDYLKAFEKSLTDLNFFSKSADEFYNFKNKEIQEFYKNSIEEICSKFN